MKLALIPGDGVGPELAREIHKVCAALESYTRLKFNLQEFPLGKDFFQETGSIITTSILEEISRADAIWIGPILEKTNDGTRLKAQVYSRLIENLGLVILKRNISSFNPARELLNQNIFNFNIIQSVGNAFSPAVTMSTRLSERDSVYLNLNIATQADIESVINYALQLLESDQHSRLTIALLDNNLNRDNPWLVKMKNMLEESAVTPTYISLDFMLFKMLHKPDDLDLVLTMPPFGQLISRMAAALDGGLGLAYESYHSLAGKPMYHVLHPTSERFTGKDAANPLGVFRSLVPILEYFKQPRLAKVLNDSVIMALEAGWSTRDLGGSMGTAEVGDFICSKISQLIE